MAGIFNKTKEYTVIAGGKASKVQARTRKDATIFTKNVIEIRSSHSLLKLLAGAFLIKTFLTDIPAMQKKTSTGLGNTAKAMELTKLGILAGTFTGAKPGTTVNPNITNEQKIKALDEAKKKVETSQSDVDKLNEKSDIKKGNIDRSKSNLSSAMSILAAVGITYLLMPKGKNDPPSPGAISMVDSNGIAYTAESQKAEKIRRSSNNDLNKIRKWQNEKYEEEISAEIYTDKIHFFEYTVNLKELCERLNPILKDLGANITLKPKDYKRKGTEFVRADNKKRNMEEDIKDALKKAKVKVKRIDIDWHDPEFDIEDDDDD